MRKSRTLAIGLYLLPLVACGGAGDRLPDVANVVSLDGIGYPVGLGTAPVTVVEFSDFGCPFCASFAFDTYPELHSEFVMSGQVRWIFVPFVIGMFPNGDMAAVAGECAGDQDRFWAMHHLLYEYQREWRREGPASDIFLDLAARAGLDVTDFERCLRGNEPAARIVRQNRIATRLGIRATPTFIIDGRLVEGALPAATFRTLLESAIDAAD